MKSKSIKITTYILSILPLVVLGCLYTYLPQQVPMHWDLKGVVTYENKVQLWLVFSLGIIMTVLFNVLPKIDPKKANYKKFGKYYDLFALTMIVFINIVEGIILIESFKPHTIQVGQVMCILVGILFVILGNLMPKIKTNFYMGIKTPWTLSDSDVWNKTHRLGGRMMFLLGILNIICGMFCDLWIAFSVIMIGALCVTIIPLVMSYIWYKGLK